MKLAKIVIATSQLAPTGKTLSRINWMNTIYVGKTNNEEFTDTAMLTFISLKLILDLGNSAYVSCVWGNSYGLKKCGVCVPEFFFLSDFEGEKPGKVWKPLLYTNLSLLFLIQ